MARQPTKTINELHRDAITLSARQRDQRRRQAEQATAQGEQGPAQDEVDAAMAIAREVKAIAEAAGYQRGRGAATHDGSG